MDIKISEDNGFLFGGVPTLVVVTVTFDNGKVVRFPYTAEKAISALYEDLSRVNQDEVKTTPVIIHPSPVNIHPGADVIEKTFPPIVDTSRTNEIEREDIVTCVKVEDRGQGASVDIHVGGQYRVLKVHGKSLSMGDGQTRQMIDGYDVIDDQAPVPFRVYVFAHEVSLLRKHGVKAKKFLTKEVDLKCPKCGETT